MTKSLYEKCALGKILNLTGGEGILRRREIKKMAKEVVEGKLGEYLVSSRQ